MSDQSSSKPSLEDLVTIKTNFAANFRRLRACARCHRLKMRCVFENPTFESCTRCFKSGLRCSPTDDPTLCYAKPRPRKKMKMKGNGAISRLQQTINEVNKILKVIELDSTQIGIENYNDEDCMTAENLSILQNQLLETQKLLFHTINAKKRISGVEAASSINSIKQGSVKSIPNLPWISNESNIIKEVIRLGIISDIDARYRMQYFFDEIYVYWPCVSFPEYYTYEWLVENDPLTLLAIITVTCLNDADLHDTLLYYLEEKLSVKTAITGDISVSFIQVYLLLSLWCSPPRKWGSYKHQMSLLMALNLSLCLDLGNEVCKGLTRVIRDKSNERQMVRAFMSVYACCGSLGLSLPRFKVVNWTPIHEKCCQLLTLGESNEADKFLFHYCKLVALGEEIFQYFCPNGFSVSNRSDGLSNEELKNIMINYEVRMHQIVVDSNLFTSIAKSKNLLSIIYYQLLMTMYDYVVCRVLLKKDTITEVYIQTLTRLIKASEKIIDSFSELCEQTSNFPTFFYYRPVHAIVALIRARLLVKIQNLEMFVDVERAYAKVNHSLFEVRKKSKVADKMSAMLSRISKWMKVSKKFNKDGATNSMVDLLDELGTEKAIQDMHVNINSNDLENGDNSKLSPKSKLTFSHSIMQDQDNQSFENFISNVDTIDVPESIPNVMSYQQQQEFLNDIFGQIDTDLLQNDNIPMFDFLGTSEIDGDWYKQI